MCSNLEREQAGERRGGGKEREGRKKRGREGGKERGGRRERRRERRREAHSYTSGNLRTIRTPPWHTSPGCPAAWAATQPEGPQQMPVP